MSYIIRSRLHKAMGVGLAAFAAFSLAESAFGAVSSWTNAVNGVWSDAAMWSAAGVPSTNAAKLTAGNGSYTATVDAVLSNPFTDLTITNNWGNTTVLNINAAGFQSVAGSMTFGRGAVVNVNVGGVMTYTGTNQNNASISVINEGLWNIAGGAVSFMDLKGATPTLSVNANVGDSGTTGRLTMTSGTFDLHGSAYVTLQLGGSAGSLGIMQMSGGTGNLSQEATSYTPILNVGGSSSRGELTLTNDAMLILSNRLYVAGDTSSSGTLTVAGNATLRMVRYGYIGVGNKTGSRGNIRVQDNGSIIDNATGIGIAGRNNETCNGTGTVTLAGGQISCGAGLTLANVAAKTTGDARLEVFGGKMNVWKGYGINFGNPASNGFARASLNMTDGLIVITNQWNDIANDVFSGFALGRAGYKSPTGTAYAVANISGGVISNSGQFGIGVWRGGTGVLYQSGGYIRQLIPPGVSSTYGFGNATIGWGGGQGTYAMSNGTFYGDSIFCVGGVTTNLLRLSVAGMVDPSIGLLNVQGGSFFVSNTMYVGAFGTGKLTVGSNGLVRCNDLVMSNNTASTLRFEMAPDGAVGQLVVTNKLTIVSGSKLEVYVPKSYIPDVSKVLTLATYATKAGAFADPDVTVSNYPGATVVQTTTKIQVRIPGRQGTMMIIR